MNSYSSLQFEIDCNPKLLSQFKHAFYLHYRHLSHLVILDSNSYSQDRYTSYDLLMAASTDCLPYDRGMASSVIKQMADNNWCFGYLGYDVKNEFHSLYSGNKDYTGFDEYSFFIPEILIRICGNQLLIDSQIESPEDVFHILNQETNRIGNLSVSASSILHRTSKEDYLNKVNQIINDIYEGNYYELNYCQEFYIESLAAEPFELFTIMNEQACMPFSAFFKNREQYILSFSPERFLKKVGTKLISQPMKGTARRDSKNATQDELLKEQLLHNEKERAENLMIVDLVRNDLTRSSKSGSINVEELCAVYSFAGVHQMISTITAELQQPDLLELLKNTFPMGSMTGAPKIEVMKRIDALEDTRRGAYSGCLGYITPEGDFDFNVLIRSLCYNTQSGYASYHTGSAITFDSVPEEEYNECLLKAQTFFSLMNQKA